MLKKFYTYGLIFILIAAVTVLPGCSKDSASTQPEPQSPAPVSEPQRPEPSSKPEPPQPKEDKPLNCDWTISINDQDTKNYNGLEAVYNLNFTATKQGGTDSMGHYQGTAHLTFNIDFSKLPEAQQSVLKMSGGINGDFNDKNVSFDVAEPFTIAPLVPPKEGEVSVAPLVEPDYAAEGMLNFEGSGSLDILVQGPQGETGQYSDSAAADSSSVPFKMRIFGARVVIEIPSAGTFEGTVTGVPVK